MNISSIQKFTLIKLEKNQRVFAYLLSENRLKHNIPCHLISLGFFYFANGICMYFFVTCSTWQGEVE